MQSGSDSQQPSQQDGPRSSAGAPEPQSSKPSESLHAAAVHQPAEAAPQQPDSGDDSEFGDFADSAPAEAPIASSFNLQQDALEHPQGTPAQEPDAQHAVGSSLASLAEEAASPLHQSQTGADVSSSLHRDAAEVPGAQHAPAHPSAAAADTDALSTSVIAAGGSDSDFGAFEDDSSTPADTLQAAFGADTDNAHFSQQPVASDHPAQQHSPDLEAEALHHSPPHAADEVSDHFREPASSQHRAESPLADSSEPVSRSDTHTAEQPSHHQELSADSPRADQEGFSSFGTVSAPQQPHQTVSVTEASTEPPTAQHSTAHDHQPAAVSHSDGSGDFRAFEDVNAGQQAEAAEAAVPAGSGTELHSSAHPAAHDQQEPGAVSHSDDSREFGAFDDVSPSQQSPKAAAIASFTEAHSAEGLTDQQEPPLVSHSKDAGGFGAFEEVSPPQQAAEMQTELLQADDWPEDSESAEPLRHHAEPSAFSHSEDDDGFGDFEDISGEQQVPESEAQAIHAEPASAREVEAAAAGSPPSAHDVSFHDDSAEPSTGAVDRSDSQGELPAHDEQHPAVSESDADSGFGDFEDVSEPQQPAISATDAQESSTAATEPDESAAAPQDDESDDGFGDFEDAPEAVAETQAQHVQQEQQIKAAASPAAESVQQQPTTPSAPERTDMLDLGPEDFLAAARALMAPFLQGCLREGSSSKEGNKAVTLETLSDQLQGSMRRSGKHHSLRPAVCFQVWRAFLPCTVIAMRDCREVWTGLVP